MTNNKLNNWKKYEVLGLCLIILFVVLHGFFRHDSIIAIISAVCGISYTMIAGKGNPICYLFGVTGSGFYSYLAFANALWGNLLLYMGYYIPMQIIGFFKWNKNLKPDSTEIVKIKLSRKEIVSLLVVTLALTAITASILFYLNDKHPILDSVTTVFSIAGMYLTVKRAIEQWIFWMIVNALSLVMWLHVALSGERVWSTVVMWAVYLFLAIYFYFDWKKELRNS